MASRCEKCGRLLSDTRDRFCPSHARQHLKHLESIGFLQPLEISTVSGPRQRLSPKRFLTLPHEPNRMTTSVSPDGSDKSSAR
jgi:hypothetical protein